MLERLFTSPALSDAETQRLQTRIRALNESTVSVKIDTELCYYVGTHRPLEDSERERLLWLLAPSPDQLPYAQSRLTGLVSEFGPRVTQTTPFSTNAVSVCGAAGLKSVFRVERSTRYAIAGTDVNNNLQEIKGLLHDPMLEVEYSDPLTSLDPGTGKKAAWRRIDLLGSDSALDEADKELGLALDDWDKAWTLDLFRNQLKRNPSDVELFDLAQSNSEHSRHWFFKGRLIVDGVEEPSDLFSLVTDTNGPTTNPNSVIKFADNSSAIEGFETQMLKAQESKGIGMLVSPVSQLSHIIFTAETHNFPTGACPFPGAATGTGGRIRDVQGAGRGGNVVAGICGYAFGRLHLPDYPLPWEGEEEYPGNFAHPRDVIVQGSNGASDYGNKFGEPVVCGFARSFGGRVGGDRLEWVKPIMFSAGVGTIAAAHSKKEEAEPGMAVVKAGGPVYRIGLGGGSASSVHVQGEGRDAGLDLGAVQRGDPEMGQKLNRLIRGLIEAPRNPIVSIHDQGAGGNGNVVKELVEARGAIVHSSSLGLGDPSLSVRELWGAEYQESNALLLRPGDRPLLERIARRERCPVDVFGTVTDHQPPKIVLEDFDTPTSTEDGDPVDLDLPLVLGKMPPKVFHMEKVERCLSPLEIPNEATIRDMVWRVLHLPSVASKRYLTNKMLVFKSVESNYLVGVGADVVKRINDGENNEEDEPWGNVNVWAIAHGLSKMYQSKAPDVYERWQQVEPADGDKWPARAGVMTLMGPPVPLDKSEIKVITFVSSLTVSNCSCPKGHSYFFIGPKDPECWGDGSYGAQRKQMEIFTAVYDRSGVIFADYRGNCLYIKRQHLQEYKFRNESQVCLSLELPANIQCSLKRHHPVGSSISSPDAHARRCLRLEVSGGQSAEPMESVPCSQDYVDNATIV